MKLTKAGVPGFLLLLALPGFARAGADSAFLYVASRDSVHEFRVEGNGGLTTVPGTPVPLGTFARTVTIVSSGPFAYLAGSFPHVVVGFRIESGNGSLTPLGGSPFMISGEGPIAAALDGSGRFLYLGNNLTENISAYAIDGSSGALTPIPGEPFPVIGVVGTGSLAADPLGRFLYLSTGAITAALSVFRIDPATGALTHVPGSPFPIDPGPNKVAADPTGRFLYVVNESTTLLSGYAVDSASGALSPIPGSPFPAGARPVAISSHPQGTFVFVGDFPGTVSVFWADATTGALAPVVGSPYPSGFQPNALQVDPSGRLLYVADPQGFGGPPFGVGGVWAHRIDPVTGSLSTVAGSPFSAGRSPSALGMFGTVPAPTTTLGLDPSSAVNPVGTSHTVTAAVSDAGGQPLDGVSVHFAVTGSVTTSGQCATDPSGRCRITYDGPLAPGTDAITAFADTDGDGVQDADEPTGAAEKTWVMPASTCGEVTGIGALSGHPRAAFVLRAEFEPGDSRPRGAVFFIDGAARLGFASTRIDALVIAGDRASLFGQGLANGAPVHFRVEVGDGRPDTLEIQLSNGYTAMGQVRGRVEIDADCEDGDHDDDGDNDDGEARGAGDHAR